MPGWFRPSDNFNSYVVMNPDKSVKLQANDASQEFKSLIVLNGCSINYNSNLQRAIVNYSY